MSAPVIEKGIPVPPKPTRRMKVLHDMKPGESVLFEEGNPNVLRSHAFREAKIIGCSVKTRKTNQGVRVWRMT